MWWWKVESEKSASKAFDKATICTCLFFPTDMSTKSCDCFKKGSVLVKSDNSA